MPLGDTPVRPDLRSFLSYLFPFFWEIRLGVGAPLPETPAPAQTRLVQKLQGGNKHARNTENGVLESTVASSAMVNDRNQREGEGGEGSAEEETRAASAVRKRPRVVDPFESGGKNKKKMKKAVAEAAEIAETVEAVPATDIAVEEAPLLGSVVATTMDATTNSSPKKRKRKKKKHKTGPLPEGQEAQGYTEGLGDPVADAQPLEGSAQSLFEEWVGIGEFQERSRSGTPTRPSLSRSGMFCYRTPHIDATLSCFFVLRFELPAAVVLPDVDVPSPMVSPKPPRESSSISSVRRPPTTSLSPPHPAVSPPLLNLTGAPPLAPEDIEGSPPKKRRRKRRKKKKAGDPP